MKPISIVAAGVAILVAVCGPVPGIAAGGSDGQRIFLDPDTGEVIEPSSQAERAQDRQAAPEHRANQTRDSRAWRTEDGVEMLTPDPDDAPMAKAVQCADGSLRIGHFEDQPDGQIGREALCGGRRQ